MARILGYNKEWREEKPDVKRELGQKGREVPVAMSQMKGVVVPGRDTAES